MYTGQNTLPQVIFGSLAGGSLGMYLHTNWRKVIIASVGEMDSEYLKEEEQELSKEEREFRVKDAVWQGILSLTVISISMTGFALLFYFFV